MRFVRVFVVISVLGGGLFGLQACCKAYCVRQELRLRFIDFSIPEIDTVLFVKYQPNSQFTIKKDSFYSTHYFTAGIDTFYHVVQNADPDFDWEIKLPAVTRAFQIGSIHTKKVSCSCEPGSARIVDSYTLGGSQYTGEIIDIKK